MGASIWPAYLFLTVVIIAKGIDADDVGIIIICQNNPVSHEKCREKEAIIRPETSIKIKVLISSRDFTHDGDWTLFPIIPMIVAKFRRLPPWVLFCTEDTKIDMAELFKVLESFDPQTELFIGHGLSDLEPTIIHHFSSKTDFLFPLLPAGFLLSRVLLKKLAGKMEADLNFKNFDFSIDPSYEFSTYLAEMGSTLTDFDKFCVERLPGCGTYISFDSLKGSKITLDEVFFAVKTCKKFHNDRVRVVKSTWGRRTKHISYYSDHYDETIPTVLLNVSNTLRGHCEKTRAIIRALKAKFKNNMNLKWAVITDDDTILSVARIADLASEYNNSLPLAIGERYGYNLQLNGGYNYLTGGGGVLLSRAALMKFGKRACLCPSPSTPDDMFLFGVCFKRIDVTLVHTPFIHQARPNDYSPEYLTMGPPVSFHKHWMVDPQHVYQQWFEDHDSFLHSHQEL